MKSLRPFIWSLNVAHLLLDFWFFLWHQVVGPFWKRSIWIGAIQFHWPRAPEPAVTFQLSIEWHHQCAIPRTGLAQVSGTNLTVSTM
jgi:hypothetical protein